MQRVAEGDEGAMADLVRALRPRTLRFLRQIGADPDAAEDLCQETFVRLWLARRRYEIRAKLSTFVLTIAYRCYLNWRQSAGVRREVTNDAVGERLVSPSRNPEEWILAAYRRSQIRSAIDALPDGQREVFQMAHLDQMPYAEIAEILGVPVGTVKSRMWSAIRLLRRKLTSST
jgi:RNA polymerase sigma factor (sigma-70 family)